MKLGTKIILGFIALIVLAMALGAVAIYMMFGVKEKAAILTNEFIPEVKMTGEITQNTFLLRLQALGVALSKDEQYFDGTDKRPGAKQYYAKLSDNLKAFKEFTRVENAPNLEKGRKAAEDLLKFASSYWSAVEDMNACQGVQRKTFAVQRENGEKMLGIAKVLIDQITRDLATTPPAGLKAAHEKLAEAYRLQEITLVLRLDAAASARDKDNDRLEKTIAVNFPKLEKALSVLKELTVGSTQQQDALREFSALADTYSNSLKELKQSNIDMAKALTSAVGFGGDLVGLTMLTNQAAADGSSIKSQETDSELTLASTVLIVGLLVALVTGLLLAWIITRGITGPINRIITNLSEAGEQVAAASGQISSASQSLAEGATEQAASLEESSSALEEMASMTRQNADNAQTANQNMSQTQQQVGVGAEAVRNMSKAMDEINDSSEKISRIIKTIEEIAFQTNLLALNAAVEAARAGDAGKGFAVVADEVRNLAQRSAQAARDTADLIESTVARVKNGTEIVQQLQKSFVDVETAANSVAGLINEISAASNEQAQGVDQVNTAVAQMDKVTQTNAANAEESASAAEELNAQADQLRSLVNELVKMVRGTEAEIETHMRPQMAAHRSAPALRTPAAHKSLITSHVHQPTKKLSAGSGDGTSKAGPNVVKPNQVIPLDDDDDFKDF